MATTTHPYTCITCQVAFVNPDNQRAHYKTDWHRYNLKRKVAELPSVTAAVFQEKVLAQKAADARDEDSKQSQYCQVCHKLFANAKSLESHEKSRKHKEMATKITDKPTKQREKPKTEATPQTTPMDTKTDVEEEEENEPLETTECLFCPNFENDMESNLLHMSKTHGFFIPDLEYLEDLEGLIEYLGYKVGVANLCLYCNERGKQFHSVEGVQHHMVEKGHCKILFEGDSALEYADFYDFTKSYPACKDVGVVLAEDTPIPDHSLIVNEDLELVLPSGMTVGHRYLKNFYKQRVPTNNRKKLTSAARVMAQYRSIGWSKSCDDGGRRERNERWAEKMRRQKSLNLGVRANKFQFHLRPQVIF